LGRETSERPVVNIVRIIPAYAAGGFSLCPHCPTPSSVGICDIPPASRRKKEAGIAILRVPATDNSPGFPAFPRPLRAFSFWNAPSGIHHTPELAFCQIGQRIFWRRIFSREEPGGIEGRGERGVGLGQRDLARAGLAKFLLLTRLGMTEPTAE
jgi:hypothetical protein